MMCLTCSRTAPAGESLCIHCQMWPECVACEGTGAVISYRGGDEEIVDCENCDGTGDVSHSVPHISADGWVTV